MKSFFHFHRLHDLALALLCFAFAAGCARTPPPAYYQLSTVDPGAGKIDAAALAEVEIGIGPVRLPDYLDRPQIVNRVGLNRLQIAGINRWAEPLSVSIPRMIRENLATVLHSEKLYHFPWNQAVDYGIPIEIIRFEGVDYRTAHLEAIWSVEDAQGNAVLPQKRSEYQVPIHPVDNEGLVRALSQALGAFSREIARQLSETVAGR